MPVKYDPNTLWVALSQYSEGNIFEVYPKLLAQLFLQEEAARQEGDTTEAEKLVLPSDKDYRLQKYFVLVELQKELEDSRAPVFHFRINPWPQKASTLLDPTPLLNVEV